MAKGIDRDGNEIDLPIIAFPTFGTSQFAPFKIFIEEAQRACKCVVCETQIAKGEKRLKFLVKLPRTYTPGHGKGVVFQEKRYAHPACLGIDRDISLPICYSCKEPRAGRTYGNVVWTGKRHSTSYLCNDCALDGRYPRCVNCGYHYPRAMTSTRVEIKNGRAYNLKARLGSEELFIVCDPCAVDNEWDTRASFRKDKRDRERLELRFEELKRNLLGSIDSKERICLEDNQ